MAETITRMNIFCFRLKQLRKEYKLNQVDLAKALKVSQSIIARWESGECEPTVTNILAIAEYFSVTTDYLLGKDEY